MSKPKIIQIAVTSGFEFNNVPDCGSDVEWPELYALDDRGTVWIYQQGVGPVPWEALPELPDDEA